MPVTWNQSVPRWSCRSGVPWGAVAGAAADPAADRAPLALTRGRRMPKNRNLLAGARMPAFPAGYLQNHLLQAVGQPWKNRQMPPSGPLSLSPSGLLKTGLFRTRSLSPGRRQHLLVIKYICQVICKKVLMLVQVRLFLLQSLIWILTGDLARQCFLYYAH